MSLHFCCASRFPTGLPQMSSIDDLLSQISDTALKAKLETEINKLTKHKKFGLVFEEHLPERTPLFGITVKKNSRVALKTSKTTSEVFRVLDIKDGMARCKKTDSEEIKEFSVNDLVPIAEFGEPIYPYLKPIDSVCNGDENGIWHTLIEADNYHALQLLEYLYPGKVDCIYIDPPYNTGARDWKYNNDYVDGNDAYRHSKWLAFMERRLKLAKHLLKKDTGVLIVAIDDYEQARLSLLLEQIFPSYDVNPVVVLHHPQGGASDNISRTHEYALFVTRHGAKVIKGHKQENISDNWSLMRGGTDVRNRRVGRPNSFFAIYVDKATRNIVGVGPHLNAHETYDSSDAPDGCIALYPVGKDGVERVWRYERESMRAHIEKGEIFCTKKLSLKVLKTRDVKYSPVFSVWTDGRYNAGTNGTDIIYSAFAGETRFAYPKSLYTVLDCIRFATLNQKEALILDFFAGSGTTLHAVNLLNADDGGNRRCIMVTNNEVSEDEAKALTKQGHQPGDEDWEKLGIARHVTWPRTVCSIEGHDVNGNPLKGNYIGSDRSMADGFIANVAFFKLGFLDKTSVALGRQFKEMLPTLWLKAGAYGICPEVDEKSPAMMVLPQNKMAILLDETAYPRLEEQVRNNADIQTVFIVTDSESGYREMITSFSGKTTYQLYRDYLDNFRINTGR